MTITKVLIADDHALVRNGLRSLLESVKGLKVIAETADGAQAVARTLELRPDIILLDVAMPNLNGIEAARRIRDQIPNAKIIMLSMHADEEYVSAALRAGVLGYVLKQEAFTQILAAIQAVEAGGVYLSPSIAKNGLADYCRLTQTPETPSALEKISTREREILQLLAEGNANAEIATHLDISVRTVESHRAKLMEKLRIYTTAGLTRFAIRHRLITVES